MARTEFPELTRAISEFAAEARVPVTPDVGEAVKRTLIDTAGVAIAGAGEAAVQSLTRTLGELPAGASSVWSTAQPTDAMTAALLNGTAGHTLAFDDILHVMRGHPSTVLWPTLLAVAQQERVPGPEVVEAYLLGLQVQAAIGNSMDMDKHYGSGWHSTATIGIVGAAAAAGRLLGLAPAAIQSALGLAASMAGGSRQNFGSMTKPLHAGMAARDAVWAAMLAGNGFTADPTQLEGPLGYFALFAPGADLDSAMRCLEAPDPDLIMDVSPKRYPCCFQSHRAADAALALRTQEDLDPAEIETVRVVLQPGAFDTLIHTRPTTPAEAKFSAEYAVATALLDGRLGLTSFTDDQVRRPMVQELIRRVQCIASPVPPVGPPEWQEAYAVVSVSTPATTAALRVDHQKGSRQEPMSRADVEDKFRDCFLYSRNLGDADVLLAGLWSIDQSEAVSWPADVASPAN